ncbi:DUF2087 domain-containing protein [Nocardiopsis composta]|uniref:DUF2087 domain-containing protein n=1 Tax=Nocardiopsis composta TaxID=157465 RepID=A0A7W8QS37_9ACTN|nr:DUF2087 domain-containing protein [Nocardiopsis composta]MBB5434838.1 hypothetical protein [Nocardiopsis composta]
MPETSGCMAVMSDPDALRLLGLLSAPERLRAFSALVLGAGTGEEVALRSGLPVKDALRALEQLERGGIAARSAEGRWSPRPETLRAAVTAAAEDRSAAPVPEGASADQARVLRSFTRDGRILTLPVQRAKRLVLLDHVARTFEPGLRYTEPEVNAMLRAFYSDHALLRRSLVDEGFLDRDGSHYWRCGGTVDV